MYVQIGCNADSMYRVYKNIDLDMILRYCSDVAFQLTPAGFWVHIAKRPNDAY
jgi:hypothetical protein